MMPWTMYALAGLGVACIVTSVVMIVWRERKGGDDRG